MTAAPPPHPQDPDLQLQRDIHRVAAEILRAMLPPPLTDTPEAWDLRNRAALAEVASLIPGNPAEARLAARQVAAGAHADDCMRQVAWHRADPKRADQLRAQAAKMGREARGYAATLLRLQAVRKKRDANDDTRESAAWTEHSFLGLMTQALDSLPPDVPPPAPEAAPPPGAAATEPPPPPGVMRPRDYEEWSDEEKRQDRVRWQADRYAILHTERVKLIRQLGGLPPDCDFEPPPPEVLHEIIHGNGSNLRWADTYKPYVMP